MYPVSNCCFFLELIYICIHICFSSSLDLLTPSYIYIIEPAFRIFELLAKFPNRFYPSSNHDNDTGSNSKSTVTRIINEDDNAGGNLEEEEEEEEDTEITSFSGIVEKNNTYVHIQTFITNFVPNDKMKSIDTYTNISLEYTYEIPIVKNGQHHDLMTSCKLNIGYIDSKHTNPYETWKDIKSPKPLNGKNKEIVMNASMLKYDILPCNIKAMPLSSSSKKQVIDIYQSLLLERNGVIVVHALLSF